MPYLIVQPGDTLRELSHRNHVSYKRLLAANPQISDPNVIYPGQVVILPAPFQRQPEAKVQRVVKPGDSMYYISREFGVPLDQVIALNPQVKDPNLIYPGMILTVKRGKACPRNVVEVVNRFMRQKSGSYDGHGGGHHGGGHHDGGHHGGGHHGGGHYGGHGGHKYDYQEIMTAEAMKEIDPRLLTGISNPANTEYDFLSCYQKSQHSYIALVALYRRRRGRPGIYDIVLENILVKTGKDGRARVANVNVQVVLRVS